MSLKKKRAQSQVREAVRRGILIKPANCEKCQVLKSATQLAGHHKNGYANILDVVWLCQKCHSQEHFVNFGERNSNASLSVIVIAAMRDLRRNGWTLQRIADKFGVSANAAWKITTNKLWKRVL